jgi:hypothetical protein
MFYLVNRNDPRCTRSDVYSVHTSYLDAVRFYRDETGCDPSFIIVSRAYLVRAGFFIA